MLKISRATAAAHDGSALKIEGQAIGQWVEELRRVCNETLNEKGRGRRRLVLDLEGLSFLDSNAVDLFRELSTRNVLFTNCSAFIAEQLKEAEK
jgi:anti-anti-sigma regulatory factor